MPVVAIPQKHKTKWIVLIVPTQTHEEVCDNEGNQVEKNGDGYFLN